MIAKINAEIEASFKRHLLRVLGHVPFEDITREMVEPHAQAHWGTPEMQKLVMYRDALKAQLGERAPGEQVH